MTKAVIKNVNPSPDQINFLLNENIRPNPTMASRAKIKGNNRLNPILDKLGVSDICDVVSINIAWRAAIAIYVSIMSTENMIAFVSGFGIIRLSK
jgi:hypothetical protein